MEQNNCLHFQTCFLVSSACRILLQSSVVVAVAVWAAPLFGFLLSVKCERRSQATKTTTATTTHCIRISNNISAISMWRRGKCNTQQLKQQLQLQPAILAAFSFISSFSQELLQHSVEVETLSRRAKRLRNTLCYYRQNKECEAIDNEFKIFRFIYVISYLIYLLKQKMYLCIQTNAGMREGRAEFYSTLRNYRQKQRCQHLANLSENF